VRIHLAGCESRFSLLALRAGCKHLLFSYYHIKGTSPTEQRKNFDAWNAAGAESVICDSGLFTMMFGAGKGKSYTASDLENYAASYIATAKKFGINNLTIVECDVHKILGMPMVHELRKRFEDSGLPVLYVWHKEEGIDGLFRMAERYKFIALSVPELRVVFKGKSHRYQDAVFDLLAKLKDNVKVMPRIHLLGNTIRETMETRLAWSCDSTSWLSSGRYGNGQLFRRNRFEKAHISSPEWKQAAASQYEADRDYIRQNVTEGGSLDYHLNHLCYAREYMKYQQWLDAHYNWIGNDADLEGRL
jgi:hypothetical protein